MLSALHWWILLWTCITFTYNAHIGHYTFMVTANNPTRGQTHQNCNFVFKISFHNLSDVISNRFNIKHQKHCGKDVHTHYLAQEDYINVQNTKATNQNCSQETWRINIDNTKEHHQTQSWSHFTHLPSSQPASLTSTSTLSQFPRKHFPRLHNHQNSVCIPCLPYTKAIHFNQS